jgi:hypothetical protein
MNWLIARLHESSTWRGIILLLTVCGMKLEPDQQEAIIAAGLAIVGLLGVFTRERPSEVVKPEIELQSRLDRELPVSDSNDAGASVAAGTSVISGIRSDRMQVAMQSPISSESRSDTKPNFTSGFNDR